MVLFTPWLEKYHRVSSRLTQSENQNRTLARDSEKRETCGELGYEWHMYYDCVAISRVDLYLPNELLRCGITHAWFGAYKKTVNQPLDHYYLLDIMYACYDMQNQRNLMIENRMIDQKAEIWANLGMVNWSPLSFKDDNKKLVWYY